MNKLREKISDFIDAIDDLMEEDIVFNRFMWSLYMLAVGIGFFVVYLLCVFLFGD